MRDQVEKIGGLVSGGLGSDEQSSDEPGSDGLSATGRRFGAQYDKMSTEPFRVVDDRPVVRSIPADDRTVGARDAAWRPAVSNEAVPNESAYGLLIAVDSERQASVRTFLDDCGRYCLAVSTFSEALNRTSDILSLGLAVVNWTGSDEALYKNIEALRQKANRPLPIILLGPSLSYDALKRLAHAGPVDVLPQMADPAELVASVRRAVDMFGVAREAGAGARAGWSAGPDAGQGGVFDMLAQIEARLGVIAATSSLDEAPVAAVDHVQTVQAQIDRDVIRTMMRFRTVQEEVFGAGLVDDAAWVMLLDLLLTRLEGKELTVTALYIGSGAPTATALRRLNHLIDKGLVVKRPDFLDRRRILVEITPQGVEGVYTVLNWMRSAFTVTATSSD